MADYYQLNALEYFNSTVHIDPESFLSPLAQQLAADSTVLDIGCGSGRDLLWLKEHGFNPTGFEQSSELAKLASNHSGCKVIEGDFTSFNFSSLSFDAIVMVGALVHVELSNFSQILNRIRQALLPEGLLYITLKEGQNQYISSDGRVFFLWSHDSLSAIFAQLQLQVLDFTRQVSKLRPTDIWLGYLLQQSSNDVAT